ncbi:MAG: D-aminoacylase [Symbiobacteriaceae bacterium]|nr:D-aminoacylase [Symbiobacteriaceae bacterium]
MLDLLIKNATLLDGSGAPAQRGDLAVKEGRIVALGGKLRETASEVVEADGLALAPGFIDIHTHSDIALFASPEAESRILQGVTTELGGNCGSSPRMLQGVTATANLTGADEEKAWGTLGEYLAALEKSTTSTNFGILMGHGTLRAAAMGFAQRPASESEISFMQNLADQAMQDGAFGISSGLIYPPSSYADVHELVAVAKAIAPYHGLYESHLRQEDGNLLTSLEEAFAVGRQAGVPVQIAHLKVTGRRNWQITVHAALAALEKARAAGIDVTADQYPYTASATSLNTLVPQWAHEGGREAFLARIADPETRTRIRQEICDSLERAEALWSDYMLSRLPSGNYPHLEGKNLQQIAEILGQEPVDAALDLILEEKGNIGRINFAMCEEDVELIMKHRLTMAGSDGGAANLDAKGVPHPRSYATFTRILGHYCRERKLFPLETAVYKMTGFPAWRMRLLDRGLLRPGFRADLTLFDPQTVRDTPTYTNPKQASEGIIRVYVNGVLTAREGKHTGAKAGTILRRT